MATRHELLAALVGRYAAISRGGAGGLHHHHEQARQASFGRRVTITRTCAGMASGRSERSSPITTIEF